MGSYGASKQTPSMRPVAPEAWPRRGNDALWLLKGVMRSLNVLIGCPVGTRHSDWLSRSSQGSNWPAS